MKFAKMAALLLFLLCKEVKAQKAFDLTVPSKIQITGFAHGLNDSTWLYLQEITNMGKGKQRMADSAMIINERFYLNDKTPSSEGIKYYVVHTKTLSEYKFFWVENQPITFSGVKGKFRHAVINGSVTEQINADFTRLESFFDVQIDSLKKNPGTENLVEKLKVEKMQSSAKFIEKNPSSVISAYLLSVYCTTWGLTLSIDLYRQLSQENKESVFGIDIKKFIALNKEIKIGSSFADIQLPTNDGKIGRLSSLAGKYILLEFWASWCGPCRKENPNLVALYTSYKSRGFEIFGVSRDTNTALWKKAIVDDKLPWMQVSDLKGSKSDADLMYGIYEIPTNFLIDPKGKIIAKNLRGDELKKKLIELLGD